MTKKTKRQRDRLESHPMYTPSDLAYFRSKGYTDDEVLAVWDRDLGRARADRLGRSTKPNPAHQTGAIAMIANAHATTPEPLPCGTKVLNTTDAEVGHVMNGFAFDPATGWYEYEVETQYGIEVWNTRDFIRFDEMEMDE